LNNCIFCKIIEGNIPSYKIFDDQDFYAFLSIGPHRPGHTLIIPKNHVDYFFDMDDNQIMKLMKLSRILSGAIKRAFNPKSGKVGILVAGLEINHAHLHLIPLNEHGDTNFTSARHDVSEKEFMDAQSKIISELKKK